MDYKLEERMREPLISMSEIPPERAVSADVCGQSDHRNCVRSRMSPPADENLMWEGSETRDAEHTARS
jgi:hypothetical protein